MSTDSTSVCPRCGTEAGGGRFCSECGAELAAAPEPAAAPSAPSSPPPPGGLAAVPRVAWVAAAFLVLVVIGSFGPWATALGVISISGTHGDGWIAIGLAAAAGALLYVWLRRPARSWTLIVAAVLALGAAGVAAYDLLELRRATDSDFFGQSISLASPAWGIYMVVFAGVLAAAAFAVLHERPLLRNVLGALAVLGLVGAVTATAAPVGGGGRAESAQAPSGAFGQDDDSATTDDDAAPASAPAPEPDDTATTTDDDTTLPPAGEPDPQPITRDDAVMALDDYSAAYDGESTRGLAALFTSDFKRRNATDPVQGKAAALATYRQQFAQLDTPVYDLSHVRLRDADEQTATVEARYAILSQNGTVRGSATFTLVRVQDEDELKISRLEVDPD